MHPIVLGASTRAFGISTSAKGLEGGSRETTSVSYSYEEEWVNSIWNR